MQQKPDLWQRYDHSSEIRVVNKMFQQNATKIADVKLYEMKKNYVYFLMHKIQEIWSISLEYFLGRKLLISEECLVYDY